MNNTLNFKMSLDSSDFTQKANDAKNAINGMGENVKKSNTFMRDYMREIKNLKAQLLQLEEGTEEYTKAMQQLADKTFALRDINETARLSANDLGERFALMTKTMSGVVEVFGMAQGAMSLFGVETENIDKALLSLTSVISIVNGAKGLEELINKNLPACINMFKGLTAQSKLCALAMKSIPYVAIGSAIVGVIGYLVKQVNVTKQLTKEQKEAQLQASKLEAVERSKNTVYQQTTQNVGEMLGKYKLLQIKWQQLGNDMSAKKRFIQENATAFNELGQQIDTVKQAEDMLINNSAAFISAIKLRAKATALEEQLKEEYKDYHKKMSKKDRSTGDFYDIPKVGQKFASEEEAKAVGKPYKVAVAQTRDGARWEVNTMTQEDIQGVDKFRQKKAIDLQRETDRQLTVPYVATEKYLLNELDGVRNEIAKNPFLNKPIKSKIPTYVPSGGYTTTPSGNNDDTTTTVIKNELLTILKQAVESGNYDDYNKEYTKDNKEVEIGSKTYYNDLKNALEQLSENTIDTSLQEKINKKIGTIPTYEKTEPETVIVNVNELALEALHTGDYSQLDNYIEQQTKAQKGSMTFFEQKINILQDVADNSSDLRIIDGVDKQVDQLKKEIEQLKQQIAKKTGKGDELPSSKQITSNFDNNTKDIITATSAIGNAFSSIAGMTNDATSSWLNYFGQVIGTIPQLITAFTSLAATEAAAGQAAQGPFGWLGIPVAIATTLSAILTSIPKFADGGIVGGNSYYGDKIIARVNSGEMILNSVSQRNLFNLLKNGGTVNNNGGTVKFKIQGQELVGVLNNYNNKMKKVL